MANSTLCLKKSRHSWETKTLGMSTSCSQSLRSNRLVVSEYEVPKVLVSQEYILFFETPCRNLQKLKNNIGNETP